MCIVYSVSSVYTVHHCYCIHNIAPTTNTQLLATEGGIYMDTDMLALKSFDRLRVSGLLLDCE